MLGRFLNAFEPALLPAHDGVVARDIRIPDGGVRCNFPCEAELTADAAFALAAGVGASAEPSLWREALVERGTQ